jgi:hypothetical protein
MNGYRLTGELVHIGLSRLLEPATENCRIVYLPKGFPESGR